MLLNTNKNRTQNHSWIQAGQTKGYEEHCWLTMHLFLLGSCNSSLFCKLISSKFLLYPAEGFMTFPPKIDWLSKAGDKLLLSKCLSNVCKSSHSHKTNFPSNSTCSFQLTQTIFPWTSFRQILQLGWLCLVPRAKSRFVFFLFFICCLERWQNLMRKPQTENIVRDSLADVKQFSRRVWDFPVWSWI